MLEQSTLGLGKPEDSNQLARYAKMFWVCLFSKLIMTSVNGFWYL